MSVVIALAYFAIAWLIGSGLVRTRQVTTNKLGLATALIFFSCGAGHMLHAVHVLESTPQALALRGAAHWHIVAWDGLTAILALNFLALRRHYGRLLHGPVMFEDHRRRAHEERLEHQAYHDVLTGLPNRAAFSERVSLTLAEPAGAAPACAVLFCDLDGFKAVNDRLGHEAGDELLRVAARRLKDAVRAGEMVARIGGDEFAVALDDVAGREGTIVVARRMADALGDPFVVRGHRFALTVSVGIALCTPEHDGPDALLRDANLAMHAAKGNGKNRYEVFEPSMLMGGELSLGVEADVRRGLAAGEFELAFQPQVDLGSGRIVGCEALVRWRHHERGLLAPRDFLPAAERSACIGLIDRFVLRAACRHAAAWDTGAAEPFVAVNLAAGELERSELVGSVASALHEAALSPGRLVLEVTEDSLRGDPATASATLHALRALGVRIALDDFGTGHSSLSRLDDLPVDILKLDRRFVGAVERPRARAVAGALVDLAGRLGIVTVAEGIETVGERDTMLALGCELGQGYLFARPMPGDEVAELLAERPLVPA